MPSHLKVELLLFGDLKLIDNNLILKASIKSIMTTNRSSVPLFWYCFPSLALIIYIHFFSSAVHPLPTLFHCSIWESSEICACAVFSCLFFGYLFLKYFLLFVLSNCNQLYCKKTEFTGTPDVTMVNHVFLKAAVIPSQMRSRLP